MDEVSGGGMTVGEQLRQAREAQGITLEDVAARTRIPTRHLQSLEDSEWIKLPAPTYTIGFAKSYASLVGLERDTIGDALRAEMGGGALAARPEAQVFEPADPKRMFPKWLLLVSVLLLAAVIFGARWWQSREYAADGDLFSDPETPAPAAQQSAQTPAAAQPAAAPNGPVVITANEAVWVQVGERGAARSLFQGELKAGQSYEVPATATAPVLRTGRPQSIRISVGTADAPPVGAADTTVSNVSLLPADLLRGPAATPASPPPPQAR